MYIIMYDIKHFRIFFVFWWFAPGKKSTWTTILHEKFSFVMKYQQQNIRLKNERFVYAITVKLKPKNKTSK